MTSESRPTRPPTAQEFVLGELRRAIVSGVLRPGEQIRQDALAERFGTSRVPLREALKILEGEGQVTYHPHRGYFVAELSTDDLVEVYRIRRILEDEAVSVAMARIDAATIASMERALAAMDDAVDDITALTAMNRAFHFALFECSGLPRLVRLIRQLWDATDAYRAVYFVEEENRARVATEHRAILDAITERDLPRTIAALHAHRDHAVHRVRTILDS